MAANLFFKYGGTSLLQEVVEDFYAKAVQHEELKHYFVGHDIERLKNHQAAFLAVLMGAPTDLYSGRGMRQAHQHLNITHSAFDAMTAALESSLRKAGMESEDVATLLTTLQSFRSEVVSQGT
ncbi:MAG: hypothetical protein RL518_28 [Pseudomonadota bacterium]|jgi:hemoglobin